MSPGLTGVARTVAVVLAHERSQRTKLLRSMRRLYLHLEFLDCRSSHNRRPSLYCHLRERASGLAGDAWAFYDELT